MKALPARQSAGVAVAGITVAIALAFAAAPPGIVVLGVVLGSLNALLAIGLVLVYRVNRVINFAHGEVGASAAVLAVLLIVDGWNYFLAVGAALIAALATGLVMEMTVVRRFRNSPRLLLTVVTIALAQVLSAISLVLPQLFDEPIVPTRFRTPLNRFELTIEPAILSGNHLVVVLVTVCAVLALNRFLTRTRYGVATRAVAENAERAVLCGVPVRSVSTLIWALAAVLSAVAAVLQAPIIGLSIGRLVGPGLLLRGLAAAVLGRMESIWVAVIAATGIGVFEQVLFYRSGRSPLVDVVLLVVIIVGLLVQRRHSRRVDPADVSTWQAVGLVKPVPSPLRPFPEVRLGKWIGIALGLAIFVVVPSFRFSGPDQNLAASVALWALVGVSLVVLSGWAGQVSLGQFALVGVGAATTGSLTAEAGWDVVFSLAGGAVAGMVAAILLGLPALRLKGFFLAVTTLAFAVATDSYLLNLDWIAPDGRVSRPVLFGHVDLESERNFYLFSVAILGLTILGLQGLRKSRFGRAVVAVRDNERSAQAVGIHSVVTKLGAFAVSGWLAGLAGGLFVLHQHRLNPDQYAPIRSLEAFTMATIGGLGSIPGAIAGAIYVRGIQDLLRGPAAILATGLGLIVVLLVLPHGLGSVVFDVRDVLLRMVSKRRGVQLPTLDADRVSRPDAAPELAHEDVTDDGDADVALVGRR